MRIDHTARAIGGGIPGYTATDGKIYRTVGRRNVEVNKSWLCDEGRLSFHNLERWPRLHHARTGSETKPVTDLLSTVHERFQSIRNEQGEASVAALGSAGNTNEALFLMKKYFNGRVDFRLAKEVDLYEQQQDELLRRLDKHPNTHGALDLDLARNLNGLRGIRELAEKKEIRGLWISFHPQLVGEDAPEILEGLKALIASVDFSVVSTTHEFPWTRGASAVLPMAAWTEEKGTFTNYAGRVQITNRAVMPPGHAQPLHVLMAELLAMSGVQVSKDPAAIFDWIARETPAYSNLSYDSIGPLGAQGAAVQEEVLR
jgi:NADH-quinone oxidoreductase subunit G